MPELPEVQTICDQLQPQLQGARLRELEIYDPRLCDPLEPSAFIAGVVDRHIKSLTRRGKYLVLELSGQHFVVMHLRMTGTLLFNPNNELKHARACFRLDRDRFITFVDIRRFGTAHLVIGSDQLTDYFSTRLGVEPLSDQFTAKYLAEVTRQRKTSIKSFLLNQRYIAGIGNIYADEALFRAGVHPLLVAGGLTDTQLRHLHRSIRVVLKAGINAKGATIDDYRDSNGAKGSFQDSFQVHMQAGKPCIRCSTIIEKIRAAGRGTYLCPECQPVQHR